jgi:ATP-dependent Lon protease
MQILELLLDIKEVIEIDDYTFQNKKDISEKFLILRTLKEFGYEESNSNSTELATTNQNIEFSNEAVTKLINHNSSPSGGVRGLKRTLKKLSARPTSSSASTRKFLTMSSMICILINSLVILKNMMRTSLLLLEITTCLAVS